MRVQLCRFLVPILLLFMGLCGHHQCVHRPFIAETVRQFSNLWAGRWRKFNAGREVIARSRSIGRSCVLGFQRSTEEVFSMFLSRRQFLKVSAGTVAAVAVADKALALTALQPVIEVGNPLGEYPDRSWERV
ncbi:MAG: twin-arginine translocation signal domain-containing protein, partial [Nitrospirota bacterium]|nr:twin-arginine translocation signal domain-containing protein [Nitrospirota bacterium]